MHTFLLVAFGVAWLCQLPVYAGGVDGPVMLALLALGGVAPSVAALIVTRGAVWRDTWRGPKPPWALLVGLALPSLLVAASGLASGSLTLSGPALGSLLLPPIGEELGWRGYLQPRVRERLGPVAASLVVGLVWALWHLPTAWGAWQGFPPFALGVIAGSVVMGWLWEASGRSVLAAVALHAGMNLGVVHADQTAVLVAWVVCAAAAGFVSSRRAAPVARIGRAG